MKIYSAILSLTLVQIQSATASWPSYYPTVWDDDDHAASSNLGVKSDVTLWPTYSPTKGDDYSGSDDAQSDDTDDYSSSNRTNLFDDDYSQSYSDDAVPGGDGSQSTPSNNVTETAAEIGSGSNYTIAAATMQDNGTYSHGVATLVLVAVASVLYLN